MNKRIQELYNQSGGLVRMYEGKLTYFPAYQKNVGNGDFEFSSFDPEKFAELVVLECVSLCEDLKMQHKGYRMEETDFSMKNIYAEGEATCDLLQHKMKKHFGVET